MCKAFYTHMSFIDTFSIFFQTHHHPCIPKKLNLTSILPLSSNPNHTAASPFIQLYIMGSELWHFQSTTIMLSYKLTCMDNPTVRVVQTVRFMSQLLFMPSFQSNEEMMYRMYEYSHCSTGVRVGPLYYNITTKQNHFICCYAMLWTANNIWICILYLIA